MPKGYSVDLIAIHRYLWKRVHPVTRLVKIHQAKLASELGLSKYTMNRKLKQMVDEKRISRVSSSQHVPYFKVIDPDVWEASFGR